MSTVEQPGVPDSNGQIDGDNDFDLDLFDDGGNDDDPLPRVDEDGNPIDDEPIDEDEEVDFDGKKYRVHKDLKDALLRNADYTQKTQELAEHRKAVQASIDEVNEHRLFMEAAAPHQAKIAAVASTIEQYEKVDWQRLTQEDPALAQQHWIAFQQAKEQKVTLEGQLGQMSGLLKQRISQFREQQLAVGIAALQKEIPNYLEVRKSLMDFAVKNFDFTPEELGAVTDPRYVRILHKAFLYDKALAKRQESRGASKGKPSQQPITNVRARSGSSQRLDLVRDADKFSDDEWNKQREAQLRAKRGKR